MQIENHFEIPLPPAEAWPILMNVAETAACFPGAGMIEQIAADQYQGRVTVKLGPLAMVFAGKLHIADRDDAAHSAAVKAQWNETKGRGNANTVTRFALQAQGEGTRVTLRSDLQLAGQVAQYGRGVGMITAISAQLITTFADNLRTRIQHAGTPGSTPAAAQAAAEISGLTLIGKALGSRLKRERQ
jgi:carbon monoxide dehydrogenase subunit G